MHNSIIPPFSPFRLSACATLAALGAACALATAPALSRAEPPTTVESQTRATAGKPVLVVSDSGKSDTLDADGRDVSIDGNKNNITLRGKCHALTISGNENTVHAEALATISTPGNKNAVTYTQTVNGEKPQITNVGSGNTISHSAE